MPFLSKNLARFARSLKMSVLQKKKKLLALKNQKSDASPTYPKCRATPLTLKIWHPDWLINYPANPKKILWCIMPFEKGGHANQYSLYHFQSEEKPQGYAGNSVWNS